MAILPNLKRLFIPHKANGNGKTPVPFQDYGDDMRAIETWAQKVVTQLVAGPNITLDPADGMGPTVEISASGGGGGGYASLTGPGQTITPGALTQAGQFTISAAQLPSAPRPILSVKSSASQNGIAMWVDSTGNAAYLGTITDGSPPTYPANVLLNIETNSSLTLAAGVSGATSPGITLFNTGGVEVDAHTLMDFRGNGNVTIQFRNIGSGNVTIMLHNTAGLPNLLGFFGGNPNTGNPATQQNVTGSRGGNAALASLLSALQNYGLIVDGTTP